MNLSDKFCAAPWSSLTLSPDGSSGACCMAPNSYGKTMSTPDTLFDAQSIDARKFRENLDMGIYNKDCLECLKKEKGGIESVRTQYSNRAHSKGHNPPLLPGNYNIDPEHITHLDLSLSNLCNFKCRYCYTGNSTAWMKDRDALVQENSLFFTNYLGDTKHVSSFSTQDLIALIQRLPNLRTIELKGGEPFLAKSHKPLLKALVETGISQQLQLEYTSNGSVFDSEIIDYWKHFELVDFSLSADGLGKVFTYCRGDRHSFEDLVWPNFLKIYNSKTSRNNIHITLNAYNILSLPEFARWLEKQEIDLSVSIGIVMNPNFLWFQIHDPQKLVDLAKTLQISSFKQVVNFANAILTEPLINDDERQRLRKSFWYATNAVDKVRNNYLKDNLPHVWDALGGSDV